MAFNSYDELKAAVADRRASILTIEVDLGGSYSPEYEAAKTELKQAQAMRTMMGGQQFLGDNISDLEAKVAALRPEPNAVWLQYRQLDLGDWAKLVKKQGVTPLDQYEEVLPQTFIGVFGVDPTENPDATPLTTDGAAVSSRGNQGILPGGSLHSVVQSFMTWQNSGGEVSIRPTKSGRD